VNLEFVPHDADRDFGRGMEFEDPEGFLGPAVLVHRQIGDEAAGFETFFDDRKQSFLSLTCNARYLRSRAFFMIQV